ncbi:hypothetical protein EON67_01715 [archaeon]|nr:MAG: hypothetical protein EON67_01715 [archaeon]
MHCARARPHAWVRAHTLQAEDIPRLCEALRTTTNEEELTTIVSQFRRMLSKGTRACCPLHDA